MPGPVTRCPVLPRLRVWAAKAALPTQRVAADATAQDCHVCISVPNISATSGVLPCDPYNPHHDSNTSTQPYAPSLVTLDS